MVTDVVGGSLASSQHGEIRATNDVDLLVDLPLDKVGPLVAAMKPAFDIWEDTVRAAVEGGHAFGALHAERLFKVDFYPSGESPLDEPTMACRQPFRLSADPQRDIYFSSPEDTILRKLDWYRASGGVLELRDLLDRCCEEAAP